MTFSTIADGYNFLVRHWHSRICRDAKGKGIVLSPGIGFTLCLDFLFYCQIGFSWKDERSNAIFIGKFSVVPFPAYPQTSVEARSAMSERAENERARQAAIIKANKILMKEF